MSLESIFAKAEGPPTANQAFNFIVSNLKKVSVHAYGGANEGFDSSLRPSECESLGHLISSLAGKIRLSSAAIDAITVMFAVAVSLEVSGPFLWMHITGPSSSLKTTILELIGAAHDKVFSVTDFTSFYSGSTVGGRDNSLLPQIQGKLFIIKDLTPLLESPKQTQDTVFPQMRDIYDGNGTKFFNNGVSLDYRGVRFVCLTGVTYIIHNFSRTDMGERFLICDINSDWSPSGEFVRMATEMSAEGNAFDSVFGTIADGFVCDDAPRIDKLDEERSLCWGLFNHLLEYMADEGHGLKSLAGVFRSDRSLKSEIDSLAEWMEHARCKMPPRDSTVRPEPALPHRSVKCLSKLSLCLAIVTKANGPTSDIKRLLRKVAFDTAKSRNLEIMNLVATNPMISLDDLSTRLSISKPHVSSTCDHLRSIGVLDYRLKSNNTGGGPGRNSRCYMVTPKFRGIADCIGLQAISLAKFTPTQVAKSAVASIFGRKTQ